MNEQTNIISVARIVGVKTRSQAVARTADRTASQHLWGSRDDSIAYMPFPIGGPLERSL